MILLYFLTLFIFSLFSYLYLDTNLFYLKDLITGFYTEYRLLISLIYLFLVFILFLFYFFFLKKIINQSLSLKKLKKIILGVFLILFFSYPAMLSYDIFNYIATSKVAFLYKENPYIMMPIDFKGEPLLKFMQASNKTALYGPTWIIISSIPFYIGFGNFLVTLFSFKLLIATFYFLTCFYINKITKNTFSLAFFALNPLVLIETFVSSHNDIVMMFFALFSLHLVMNKKILFGFIFLIFSILIKFSTVFLVPIFLYMAIKHVKRERINWNKIFVFSSVLMFIVFLSSMFREEIYSWYALWFLVFVSLSNSRLIQNLSILISLGLLLKYVPFMLLGSHFGIIPYLKLIILFSPALVFILFIYAKKWLKRFSL